jgi:ribosome maturation factor RimP
MLKERVQELLDEAFNERPDLFLIDFKMGASNDINITIDGDEGVMLSDCMFVSRAVEHQLDRDEYDFSLEVASAGASTPLQLPRQYKKHLGRTLEIEDLDGSKEKGVLDEVTKDGVKISWKTREPKPVGKGKVTVEKVWSVDFEKIKKAKIVITFN